MHVMSLWLFIRKWALICGLKIMCLGVWQQIWLNSRSVLCHVDMWRNASFESLFWHAFTGVAKRRERPRIYEGLEEYSYWLIAFVWHCVSLFLCSLSDALGLNILFLFLRFYNVLSIALSFK